MITATETKDLALANPDILIERPGKPSAACILGSDIILNTLLELDDNRSDTSFTRQIKSVADDRHLTPQVYLFTAFSAVPFADTLRGYYDASPEATPPIGHIKASRRMEWETEYAQAREAERLQAFLGEATRVCVVEEYVVTGQTLRLAQSILDRTGVTTIHAIRGRWDPFGLNEEDVDLKTTSSKHADMLYEIGQAAYMLNNSCS